MKYIIDNEITLFDCLRKIIFTQTNKDINAQLDNISFDEHENYYYILTDKNFGEATEFLIKGCKLSFNIFDSKWNCNSGWRHGSKSGPKGYLKDYQSRWMDRNRIKGGFFI